MSKRVVVVSAGLRSPSSTKLLADQLAAAVERLAAVEVRHVEVREHAHAIADALMTGFPSGALAEDLGAVAGADALIVVTPTFQASYSGLFKSFMDLVETDSVRGTPVLLAATGGSERHSLMIESALRPLFAYLGAVSVPTGVYAATSDFGGEYAAALAGRVDRAASELATLAGLDGHEASGRSVRRTPVDEFADVTPFSELLNRVRT
ncbi:FMN reductase [Granulicoccus sp. GXG6511]|uniref:FMN reductase n=1 Tax=Granulicoccus sp. GXG6511 TaxID=3381351 RepID=UPI003D7F0AA4